MESILDALGASVVVLDRDLHITRYSAGSTRILCDLPASVGKPFTPVSEVADVSCLAHEAHNCLRTATGFDRDLWVAGRQLRMRLVPQVRPDGSARGMVILFIDRFGELGNGQNAHPFADVMKNSSDAIVVQAPDGRILAWNHGAEQIYGYSEAEALGMNMLELVPEARREEHREFLQHVLSGDLEYRTCETVRLCKDGRELVVWLTANVLSDDAGRPYAVAVSGRNIMGLREAEAQLADLSRVSAMGQMTAGLAHELNQPLAAIAHYCDAALSRAHASRAVDAQLVQYVNDAYRQAQRAGDVIRHLVRFIRKRQADPVAMDLGELIKDTLRFSEIVFEPHDVAIAVDLEESLSAVMADSIQIQQVLINLQSNSIEAMQQSATLCPQLTISVRRHDSEFALISVADTGPGFTARQIERLFQPFQSTKSEGMGLGLTISRTIVEAHGGRLWVQSPATGGAVAAFTLPFAHIQD